jgi:hypothetical protein
MILVLEVDSSNEIQSIHLLGKPMFWSTSNKNGQETESKAFAISNFNNTAATFLAFSHLELSCTALKLSWIDLPFMKADWLGDTISCKRGARRLARHLVNSLLKLWIKLMGL